MAWRCGAASVHLAIFAYETEVTFEECKNICINDFPECTRFTYGTRPGFHTAEHGPPECRLYSSDQCATISSEVKGRPVSTNIYDIVCDHSTASSYTYSYTYD